MDKIVKKFKRSQKVVEANNKKFEHDMELKKEKHRLREHDLHVERERMKQIEQAKKEQIVAKEEKDTKNTKNRQLKQTIIRDQLMNTRIRDLIKKDQLMETIQTVVHDDTSPRIRNKMLAKNNLNLSISRAILSSEKKSLKVD
jgi:hypothetical protein